MKENTYVRTAADLERKYNLVGIEKAVKQTETGLAKTNTSLENFVIATTENFDNIENQLDGIIETFYMSGIPTLENEPASEWEVSKYKDHVGDMYYDKETGYAYRFSFENNQYGWQLLKDQDIQDALTRANAAEENADGKNKIFTSEFPEPPYDVGDLWLNNKQIYICQNAKSEFDEDGNEQHYEDGDFIIATDYVTNSKMLTLEQFIGTIDERVAKVITTDGKLTAEFETIRKNASDSSQILGEWSKQIDVDGDITLSASNSTYKLKIENDGIAIYDGNEKASYWKQREFYVEKKINIGNFAFIPRKNGSLGFRKVR